MKFSWGRLINKILDGESLTEPEAAGAMAEIMDGAATPAQIAGFVVALRAKGESADELTGLVRAMRAASNKVEVTGKILDTCGTGGDRSGTFNVSTAAALVCAGAGVRVAKHGNRAMSSHCGSADVLEALGVRIDLPPEGVASCIDQAGIGFCFAPLFHPAMRHSMGPRRELGVATIFNFLGPLTNPAGATRQALGVSDPRMLELMVETLGRLGSRRVVAFHGAGGLDELSTSGPSKVVEFDHGEIRRWEIDPGVLGLPTTPIEAISGSDAASNAAMVKGILEGERGPARDIVALNAAVGLLAAGFVSDIGEGLDSAVESIDSGSAGTRLDALISASSRLS